MSGGLDSRWASWFDGSVTRDDDGATVITIAVPDQAALHGVLQAVRDLGLPLLSVTALEQDAPTSTSRSTP